MLESLNKIVGINFNKHQIDQLQLPMRLGGLGLRSAEKHREASFISSFNSSEPFLTSLFAKDEINDLMVFFLEDARAFDNRNLELSKSQKVVSEDIDNLSRKILIHNANESDRARILSSSGNQISLILTAPLGTARGFRLTNQEFQTYIQHLLGTDVTNNKDRCRHCQKDLDTKGYHCLVCKKGDAGPIARHNAIRNIIFNYCQKAIFNPRLEIPIMSGSKQTPADIYLPNGANGKPVAIDVTISHPQAKKVVKNAADETGYANKMAAIGKVDKHQAVCQKEGIKFVPFAIEIFGTISQLGTDLIEQIATAISNRISSKKSNVLNELLRKIQFSLVRSINAAISSRSPGRISI